MKEIWGFMNYKLIRLRVEYYQENKDISEKLFFFNMIDLLQSSMYCKVFMNSVISIFICCYIAIMAIGLNRHFHAF